MTGERAWNLKLSSFPAEVTRAAFYVVLKISTVILISVRHKKGPRTNGDYFCENMTIQPRPHFI
jgi:hypothetical protein